MTVNFAVLSPQVNVIIPVRISSEVLYPTAILTILPLLPDLVDVAIQSLLVVNLQLSELVTVIVCSPPAASNSISVGSMDIEYSFASCVIFTFACLSPHLKVAIPVRISGSEFSSTMIFTEAPFSPLFSEDCIQYSSDENSHSSELVIVTVFASPAAIKDNSVGSTEME